MSEGEGVGGRARRGEEESEGVGGDGGVGGVSGFEGVVGEDGCEFVDGAGESEGAGVAVVGESVADAGKGLVEVVRVKGFVLFVQVRGPEGVESFHVLHLTRCDAGVVDVNKGDNKAAIFCESMLDEDSSVVDALTHALPFDQVLVVLRLPDASGISASSHVPGYPDHVDGAAFVMSGEVAVIVHSGWDASVDEAPAVSKGRSRALIVCAADVNGMLKGAALDSKLGYEA